MAIDVQARRSLKNAARLHLQGKSADAEAQIRRVLADHPDSIEALVALANLLVNLPGRQDEAEGLLDRVADLDPDCIALPTNYGVLASVRGDAGKAEHHFREAVSREPDSAKTRVNLANCLHRNGKHGEAVTHFKRAIQISPRTPVVHGNLAATYEHLCQYREALDHYTEAIRLRPDFARARYARGMLLLRLGRFKEGWREYEWRFEATGMDYLDKVEWGTRLWQGEPFSGRRLLVYHEQGLGDGVHFLRYLPRVKELGGEVVFKCGPPLFRLVEELQCVDEIISRRTRLSKDGLTFDYHVPLMSLPRIFGTQLIRIPADVPYVRVPSKAIDQWAKVFDRRKLNVGLAWSGKESQARNRERSCRLVDLTPLGNVPGVDFYSLQKGRTAPSQIAEVGDALLLNDYTKQLRDLYDVAAFMENLDLVITVDTVTAHLAGALGMPTWTMLCKTHCWRYLLERRDSPWYATMTLFRQAHHGDWSAPVADIHRRLHEAAREKREQGISPRDQYDHIPKAVPHHPPAS